MNVYISEDSRYIGIRVRVNDGNSLGYIAR